MLIISRILQWNHNCISRSLLIVIRLRVLIYWVKRKEVLIHWMRKNVLKRALNWAVWQKKRKLTIRRLILRLIQSLTRKVRTKTSVLTISIYVYLSTSIIVFSVTLMHCSITAVSFIDLKSDMLLHVQLFNELHHCDLRNWFSESELKLTI